MEVKSQEFSELDIGGRETCPIFQRPTLTFRTSFDKTRVQSGSVNTMVRASPIGIYLTQANWNMIRAAPIPP